MRYVFAILALITSCNLSKKDTSLPLRKTTPVISLEKAELLNMPLNISKNEFDKQESTYYISDSCSSTSIKYKQGQIYFDCINFKDNNGLQYRLAGDTVSLYLIDFEVFTEELSLEEISLSSSTTLDAFRNALSLHDLKLNEAAAFPYNQQGMRGIYLNDAGLHTQRPAPHYLRVWFRNDSLKGLEYNWQPAYSKQQWQEYLRLKKELYEK